MIIKKIFKFSNDDFKDFRLKFFKYLIRRRFALRRKKNLEKNSFLKSEALKMKDFKEVSIRFFKKIIKIDFSYSNFNR